MDFTPTASPAPIAANRSSVPHTHAHLQRALHRSLQTGLLSHTHTHTYSEPCTDRCKQVFCPTHARTPTASPAPIAANRSSVPHTHAHLQRALHRSLQTGLLSHTRTHTYSEPCTDRCKQVFCPTHARTPTASPAPIAANRSAAQFRVHQPMTTRRATSAAFGADLCCILQRPYTVVRRAYTAIHPPAVALLSTGSPATLCGQHHLQCFINMPKILRGLTC